MNKIHHRDMWQIYGYSSTLVCAARGERERAAEAGGNNVLQRQGGRRALVPVIHAGKAGTRSVVAVRGLHEGRWVTVLGVSGAACV